MAGWHGTIGPAPERRLHIAAVLAMLLAMTALLVTKQTAWLLLGYAAVMLVSFVAPARLPSTGMTVLLRLLLIVPAVIVVLGWESAGVIDELVDSRWMNLLAYLSAAEMAVQAWSPRPSPAAQVLLPCAVFFAAGNTYSALWIQIFAPAFLLCLLLALRGCRPREAVRPRGSLPVLALGLLLALGLGFTFNVLVGVYRATLNSWSIRLITFQLQQAVGLSLQPQLGRTFGYRGSPRRVLRLVGMTRGICYLRGVAFDTYHRGRWFPNAGGRTMLPLTGETQHAQAQGSRFAVTPLEPLNQLVFTTLDTTGVDISAGLEWAADYGGPLVSNADQQEYQVILAGPHDPLLWGPPGPAERRRLLAVPAEIPLGVRQLAQVIGGRQPTPEKRMQAVALYLRTRHGYSLTTDPGLGDPVTNFLLDPEMKAHCEYFASAATILLRCLGVPSRYVVGYYAYERQPDGAIIVRQRDAHAWTECWIDGKGWTTVETTPSDGRPDAAPESQPSLWMKTGEWLQDQQQRVRAWLARLSPRLLALAAGGMAGVYLVLVLLRERRRRRLPVAAPLYTPVDSDLTSLALRFAAWQAGLGLPCPPGRPWQDHLARAPVQAAAREFVLRYNAARFGPARDAQALAALDALMTQLEKDALHDL